MSRLPVRNRVEFKKHTVTCATDCLQRAHLQQRLVTIYQAGQISTAFAESANRLDLLFS